MRRNLLIANTASLAFFLLFSSSSLALKPHTPTDKKLYFNPVISFFSGLGGISTRQPQTQSYSGTDNNSFIYTDNNSNHTLGTTGIFLYVAAGFDSTNVV